MVFILFNNPGISQRLALTYDADPLQTAELSVDFTSSDVLIGDVNLDGRINLLAKTGGPKLGPPI